MIWFIVERLRVIVTLLFRMFQPHIGALCLMTEVPEQTMQTYLDQQSTLLKDLHCLPFCHDILDTTINRQTTYSHFKVITVNGCVVQIFRLITV